MNGNLMLKTGKIEVPVDRYMAPPPSRKEDATYLSPWHQKNIKHLTISTESVLIQRGRRW